MADSYELILDRLRDRGSQIKFSNVPRQAIAQCPHHDDHNPSLRITGIEGQVLLHCHAGCQIDDVLAALNLERPDLFDDRKGATYRYGDGREVHRTWDKRFKQTGNTNGHKTRLYREPKVAEAVEGERVVFLVEGEKDVLAIEAVGGTATTAPMGAGNIDKADLTPLYGARVVAIVDRPKDGQDTTGEQWARYLRRQLGGKADIDFTQAKVGKDAADHIAAGLGLDQLEPYTFPLSVLLQGTQNAAWLGQQVFDPLEWIVPGVIPEGYSLLVGAPKIGKSWLSLSIALAVSSGGYMFGSIYCGRPRPVLLLALEDSHRRIQSRLRKLQPEDPVWPELLSYRTTLDQGMAVETIDEWLLGVPRRERPLVILDTIGKVIPVAFNGESSYQRDYRFSSRLQAITQRRPGMAVIGLHHDRKATTDDFVESISGTNGIAGAADTILVINRPRTEAEGVLSITGRDVDENQYGLRLAEGTWTLMGGNLREAAKNAHVVHATTNLGETSAEIIEFVAEHPEGVRGADVAPVIGATPKEASDRLRWLFDHGRLNRAKRGLYTPLESVESEESPDSLDSSDSLHSSGYRDAREAPGLALVPPEILNPNGRATDCQLCGRPLAESNNQCPGDHYIEE